QGHQWEAVVNGAAPPGSRGQEVCPVCGAVVMPPTVADGPVNPAAKTAVLPPNPRASADTAPLSGNAAPVSGDASTLTPPATEAEPDSATTMLPSQSGSQRPVVNVPGYDVQAELGRGGMGVVYQARQRGLNRLVALKMILAGAHASSQDLDRFRNEAEAVAALQHPNIVQIHAIGEQEGLPYFALEFVDCGSLAQLGHGRPMPVPAATAL